MKFREVNEMKTFIFFSEPILIAVARVDLIDLDLDSLGRSRQHPLLQETKGEIGAKTTRRHFAKMPKFANDGPGMRSLFRGGSAHRRRRQRQ